MAGTNRRPRRSHGEAGTGATGLARRAVSELVAAVERGEIDALVLPTPEGDRVFTASSDEHPYRVLIEAISEGAITLDSDGTILYSNSAFARLVGFRLEKVIGSYLSSLVAAADHPRLQQLLSSAHGAQARAEIMLLTADGHTVPAYVSAQPLPGEDDRLCAVITDLTEVEQAREAHSRLASIVEHSADAIISLTPEGEVLTWNKGAEGLLGYKMAEMLGQSVLKTVPIDRCEEFLRLLDRIRQGSPIENLEFIQLRKNGTPVDVLLTLSPVCDRQGRVLGASAIAHDNSSSRRAQRRLESVLKSAPDAIIAVDHNSTIVLVNSQAEVLFGHSRPALVGQPLSLVLGRGREECVAPWLGQVPGQHLPGDRHQITAIHADGHMFPAEVSVGGMETEDGTLVCASIRDVSERLAFQQALRETNTQLQAALRAKDHFLATMSHELRTPLMGIIGFIGVLLLRLSGPLNEAQVRQLELVRSSARHLLAIINDLLDLARIEVSEVQLQRDTFCCATLLEETIRELADTAEQKDIELKMIPPAAPVMLHTDRRYLRQILSNLLGNAVKFTDTGGVQVRIEAKGEGPSRTVAIAIIDTGIGIQRQDLSRLFVDFCRVQSSSEHREGTGLGLHLSQKLALLLGGRITVSSEFGKGSVFTLTLTGC